MQQQKLIPFKWIKPVKFMGINSSLPFCSLIDQSNLIYLSGRSIILQNIKTYEQKIIWTNQFQSQPEVIQHIISINRENIVGIAIRNQTHMNTVIIMNINSQINNYQHLNMKQRQKDKYHYLKNLMNQPQNQEINIYKMKFLQQGSLFAVAVGITRGKQVTQEQKHFVGRAIGQPKRHMYIYSSLSGDLLYSCNFQAVNPLVQGLQLNRLNFTCVVKNQPQDDLQDNFLLIKKTVNAGQHLDDRKQKHCMSFFKISLLNSSQLSSKNDFLIQLQSGQTIIQIRFFQNHKKTFAFFLLTSGFVLMFMVNERGFHDCVRVDVRIDKIKHFDRMKMQKQKLLLNLNSQKAQPSQQGTKFDSQTTYQINKKGVQADNFVIIHQRSQHKKLSAFKGQSRRQGSREQKQPKKSMFIQLEKDENQYFYPSCITCASCKLIVGYENCSFIGLIRYSAVDHKGHKFSYIFDFLYEKTHVQSIRKIDFSEDGCHCSILTKVNPSKIQTSKQQSSSVNLCNKFSTKHLKCVKKSKLPSACSKDRPTRPKFSPDSKKHEQRQQLPAQKQKQFFQVFHVDFISGMIEHEYHNEAIEESLTKASLKGTVQFIQFNKMNNSMFILMTDGKLYYYYLNLITINCSNDDNELGANSKAASSLATKMRLESNGLSKQKSVQNYLSPQSIPLWMQKIKYKPFIISCHPSVFQLILVFQDNVRFHFYNADKLFQTHHVLSLKNCKAASYSPYGDKLALGSVGSIWLVDSYTHQVVKKISLVIFPTAIKRTQNQHKSNKIQGRSPKRSDTMFASLSSKTVSKIQYINNEDIIIQTGNKTLSMLLNYQKVLFYGSTQSISSQLISYDYKHRLGVIATENCLRVITKCSLNSKTKCQQLAKVQLSVTALKICGQIDTLFLGGQDGVIHFIRWPEFFQNDTLKQPQVLESQANKNKLHLFHSPIFGIQVSINYKQLFVLSKQGEIVICQLSHSDQVQKIGKEVSFVMSKKIDLQLSLANKWFLSLNDQQKGAQSITKLMGNQAQMKNNQFMVEEQYRKQLQQQSQQEKLQLQQLLKQQIKRYEVQSGISKLQQSLSFVKDEMKRVMGKRQLQFNLINQKIDLDLHEGFIQTDKLEKQLEELKGKSNSHRQEFVQELNRQMKNYHLLVDQQTQGQERLNQKTEAQHEQQIKIDQALQQNMREDFMDEKEQIRKHYRQLLADQYQQNKTLMAQNRNKKVQITQVTGKIRQFSTRTQQLQNDIKQLQEQSQQVLDIKEKLSNQIIQTDKKYHTLIRKTKEDQTFLNKIRNSSQACQLKYNDLQEQMQRLQKKWRYIQEKREENQIHFVQQFKTREFNTSQLEKLKEKIKAMKTKRKKAFDNSVLLKDLIKIYQPLGQSSSQDDPTTIHFQQSSFTQSQMIEIKKGQNTKLTSDVQKWAQVRNDNKDKFFKYNQKLGEQNNKLIYRCNQLQRQHKDWVKLQRKIKNDILINKQKLKEPMDTKNGPQFTFVNGQGQTQSQQRVYNSVHRKTLNCDNKFIGTQTCHFSTTKSLSRPLNCQNLHNQIPSLFKTTKQGQLNSSQQQLSSSQQQLFNRSSTKVLYPSLQQNQRQKEKEKLKKSLKNQLKYNGVILDKNSLKPKKTMCLSLHQDGEDSGKFVTQY